MKVEEEIFKHKKAISEWSFRASGRSTRIIDESIQHLFEIPNKWITVIDHYDSKMADMMIVKNIKRRLKIEHNLEIDVRTDNGKFQIKLKDYHKPDFTEQINFHKAAIVELTFKLKDSKISVSN